MFEQLAKLSELHALDDALVKNYNNAAFQIDRLPDSIANKTDKELASLRGIGSKNAQKILEFKSNGVIAELHLLIENTPKGILDVMKVKGLGPKKARVIWKEMKIESVGELLYACSENRLLAYKGFGEKLQEQIKLGCEFFLNSQGKFLWHQVEQFAHQLLQYFKTVKKWNAALTGAFRRGDNIVEEIEFVIDQPLRELLNLETTYFKNIVQEGEVIICEAYDKKVRLYSASTNFGTKLFSTTNLKTFNDDFEALYTITDCPLEQQLFSNNNLSFIAPELRGWGLSQAIALNKNKLISVGDIKGIIHNHSTYSDGAHSLLQMAMACKQLGYQYFVISDHSAYASYAGGLSIEQVYAQHKEIDELNKQLAPFKIFKSIECDILPDGNLDYDPETLSKFDLVIASIHSNLNMTKEKAMERLFKAISNPFTTILGHPTGRLLLSRNGYTVDMPQIIDWCAQYNVAIEINAHPRRLDLDASFIPYAMEKNVLLSINPDAHSVQGIQDVKYGVNSARQGGLTAAMNLSSLSLLQLEEYLIKYKEKLN